MKLIKNMSKDEQVKLTFRDEDAHKSLPKPTTRTIYENPYRFVYEQYKYKEQSQCEDNSGFSIDASSFMNSRPPSNESADRPMAIPEKVAILRQKLLKPLLISLQPQSKAGNFGLDMSGMLGFDLQVNEKKNKKMQRQKQRASSASYSNLNNISDEEPSDFKK